ncbi:MAG: DUF4846 domain-containing protein [Bacteroidia bacterium]
MRGIALYRLCTLSFFFLFSFRQGDLNTDYKWLDSYSASTAIVNRIPVPGGYKRPVCTKESMNCWFEHLPLKPEGTVVKLYNGQKKNRQDVHEAVINIDCGNKDLQQCADAVMRLHAEFLYSRNKIAEISFNYTSGDKIPFKKWSEGFRPGIKANKVTWVKKETPSSSYATFKKYMENVYNYAGSLSLSRELKPVNDLNAIETGDVFIVGGSPGHAVTVVDVAVHEKTGKKIFLIAQSYMPAQDIHILKNFNSSLSPWYSVDFGEELETPEWTFTKKQLMRFK